MLGIFIMLFNFMIFGFVGFVVVRNILNLSRTTSEFNNIYNYASRKIYDSTKQEDAQRSQDIESVTFDSSFVLDNNPIKEKRR